MATENNFPASWDLVRDDLNNLENFQVKNKVDYLYAEAAKLAFAFKAAQLEADTMEAIIPALFGDIEERNQFGIIKYNKPLTPFDGRDMLKEAYEELLDLIVYLRTEKYERDNESKS